MAKLTRFTQKIFGSGAGLNQISKYGSLFAGSPAFTTDAGQAMSLSNWLTGWFAAAIGGNAPAIEDMNAVCFVLAYQLAYLMQSGVPEWDAGTTYYTHQIVAVDGALYVSLQDDNTNHLVTAPTWWTKIGGQVMTALGDIIYGGVSGAQTALSGNTDAVRKHLEQIGDGLGSSNPPSWVQTKVPTMQKFVSGSGNYTTPAGVLYIEVEMVGAGGGGGGSGASGTGGTGTDGGNTTFGSDLAAGGGAQGGAAGGIGGIGGTASLGVITNGHAIPGSHGAAGAYTSTGQTIVPGSYGGSSPFSGGGPGGYVNGTGYNATANTGSGGGGGQTKDISSNYGGGGGGSGGYIKAIIAPTAGQVFAYAIGAKGTKGVAGTNGFDGGDGADGIIIVREYYQ